MDLLSSPLHLFLILRLGNKYSKIYKLPILNPNHWIYVGCNLLAFFLFKKLNYFRLITLKPIVSSLIGDKSKFSHISLYSP